MSLFLTFALNLPNFDMEETCWMEMEGEWMPFLHGRMKFEVAKEAQRCKYDNVALRLALEAQDEFVSPDLLAFIGGELMKRGKAEESLTYWKRLEKSGLMLEDALRYESKALESLGRRKEAVAKEAERFRFWGYRFSDAELYRYCAMSLMTGDAKTAERISRTFRLRSSRGGGKNRWTPEWSNLRGGALLALGRRNEAKPYFEDAIQRKPSLQSARRNLENLENGF